MSSRRNPRVLTLCLWLVRLVSTIVPSSIRPEWRAEWDAEVRHRWGMLEQREHLDWGSRMNLLRRSLGSVLDAAWLRRQLSTDAEAVHDLRHGVRFLWRSPGFTVAAVLILAVGVGGTVAISALLDTLVLRPLPYDAADRIVTIWSRQMTRPEKEDVAPADFLDWRERTTSFSAVAAVVPYSFDYTGGERPEVLFGAQVTEGFWDIIGMQPALGRGFLAEEEVRGGPRSVIISHGLWQSRFGGAPSILNRAISLDGEPWTVVGILPREFAPQLLPRPGELSVWTPKIIQDHERQLRGSAWWNVVARLRPGVTVEQAQREMDSVTAALAQENPRTNSGRAALVVPLREHLMWDVRLPLLIMLGAVLLVLGIGCANVASLLLARGIEREREFAIRAALGASRWRLVRQLITESLLLAVASAIVGVALAQWSVRAIVAMAPGGVLRLQQAGIDGRMLAFAAALICVTAMAFGVIPALRFSNPSRDVMRERHASGPRARFRRALVVAEISFALVLLTGAGLLIRSFERLMAVDPGFSSANVVTVQVFAWDRNTTPDRIRDFFARTIDRLAVIPGVQAAGAVSAMPFAIANIDIKTTLDIVGRPEPGAPEQRIAYLTFATPGYFRAMSIPLRDGRLLEPRDDEHSPLVAVISDALRRREWPTESPIGRRIRLEWQGQPLEVEVVGVVGQIRHDRLDGTARPEVFVPLAQVPFASMTYVVRGKDKPAALIELAKRAIWSVDPLQTIYDAASLAALVDASVVRQRFSATVMSAFAAIALLLCASGIYGIISFTTAQRTREIGLRIALGADRRTIRRMVLREGSGVIATGVLLGVAGATASSRILQSLLFEVRPGDPLTLLTVCAVLATLGLTACYVPARRATRVDPLVALRDE